jgi:hypothetical protein
VRKLRDGTNNGDRSHLKKKRILLVQKEVSTIHMLVTENLVTGIFEGGRVRVVVFYSTLDNISSISWLLVLLMEETGVSIENQQLAASH